MNFKIKQIKYLKTLILNSIPIFFLFNKSLGQTPINCNFKTLQGSWVNVTENEKTYWQIKENKLNSITLTNTGNIFSEVYNIGFSNSPNLKVQDSVNINQLKNDGKYFYIYSFNHNHKYVNFISDYIISDCDSLLFSITSSNPFTYQRIEKIPPELQEYFLPKRKLKVSKSFIYESSSASIPTKMYLVKGDFVEILRKEKEWVKVKFIGKKVVQGWIKYKVLYAL